MRIRWYGLAALCALAAPQLMLAVSFNAPQAYFGSGSLGKPVSGDFNGDGKQDLAIVASPARAIAIMLGNGDGTFQPMTTVPLPGVAVGITVSDFNCDGKLDLAVTDCLSCASPGVAILLGNGDGTFQPAVTYQAGKPGSAIAAGDSMAMENRIWWWATDAIPRGWRSC